MNLVDPEGKNPIVGALIGAGLDMGIQITTNILTGEKWYKIDGKSVAISAAAGAAGAGLLSKAKQACNLTKMGKAAVTAVEATTEAFVSGAESAAKQYVSDGSVSVKETLTDAVIGGVASAAGSSAKAGQRASAKGKEELRVLEDQLDHAERVARGNNPRASRQAAVDKAKANVENYGDKEKEATSNILNFGLSTAEGYYYNGERKNK